MSHHFVYLLPAAQRQRLVKRMAGGMNGGSRCGRKLVRSGVTRKVHFVRRDGASFRVQLISTISYTRHLFVYRMTNKRNLMHDVNITFWNESAMNETDRRDKAFGTQQRSHQPTHTNMWGILCTTTCLTTVG